MVRAKRNTTGERKRGPVTVEKAEYTRVKGPGDVQVSAFDTGRIDISIPSLDGVGYDEIELTAEQAESVAGCLCAAGFGRLAPRHETSVPSTKDRETDEQIG